MPVYRYRALNRTGQVVTGELEAPDRRRVMRDLFSQQFKPLAIDQRNQSQGEADVGELDFFQDQKTKRRLRPANQKKESLAFLKKLLELLNSGMPLGDALRLLSHRLTEPEQKKLADDLWRRLSEGGSFAQALAGRHDVFSEADVRLVEAGEASGNLAPVLGRVVTYKEEMDALRAKIMGGLAYPAVVSLMALAVVAFFLFVLLPQVKGMMENIGGELPFLTRALIGTSEAIIAFGPFVLGGLAIAIFALYQYRRTAKGRKQTDHIFLKLPVAGRIYLYALVFRISNLISTLLGSGVNTPEALRLTERVIGNTQMRAKFNRARTQIQEGTSLATAFRKTHFFPSVALDILTVGENTGNVINSMTNVNTMYGKYLTDALARLTTAISTIALIFAFSLVLLIALSIILSVLGVTQSLSL